MYYILLISLVILYAFDFIMFFVFLFYAELLRRDSHWSIATLAAHDEVGIKLQNIKLLEGTK